MNMIKHNIAWYVFMVAFLFFSITGYWLQTDTYFSSNAMLLLQAFVLSLVFAVPIIFIINIIWWKFLKDKVTSRQWNRFQLTKREKSCWTFWITFLILICIWFLYLLAYYPGIFSYDVKDQLEYTQSVMNTHHPIVHTLLLDLFINRLGGAVGSLSCGFLFYCIFQIIIFALQISYAVLFLYRAGIKIKWLTVFIGFLAVFPVFGTMAISSTKDTLFAGCLIDYFVCIVALIYFIKKDKRSKQKPWSHLKTEYFVVAIISGIGTCVLRNNGIVAVALSTILVLIIVRPLCLKIVAPTVIVVISSMFILVSLKFITSAQIGSKLEPLAVPLQQMAYVYKEHRFDSDFDNSQTLDSIFPDIDVYNPALVDKIKEKAKDAKDTTSVINIAKEYISLGIKYPADYIVAFINNARGYLYVADTSFASVYGNGADTGYGYIISDTKDNNYGIIQESKIPWLKDILGYWFNDNYYQDNILSVFAFSISVWNWLFMAFFIGVVKKRLAYWTAFFIPFFWLLTLLAGPCCLIRYAFPIFALTPISGFLASRRK